MASSKEAFDKFWVWKKSRTLLKVTVWEKGVSEPGAFIGAVTFPDEEFLVVGFANHDTRSACAIRFDDCSFRIKGRFMFADRFGEEFFECEDTGKSWNPV